MFDIWMKLRLVNSIILYQEMSELKTLEAKIYKALDNMEGALSHNESDLKTWEPHEYELTKN